MIEAKDVVLLLKQDYDYRFYPEDKTRQQAVIGVRSQDIHHRTKLSC